MLHEANGGHTDWFYDSHHHLFFKGIYDQQMHICIPSHVKSIDSGLIEFM